MQALEFTHSCYFCRFWAWNATYTAKNKSLRVRPRPSPAVLRPCIRRAPTAVSETGAPVWPRVANGHYCGEYERDVRLYGEVL